MLDVAASRRCRDGSWVLLPWEPEPISKNAWRKMDNLWKEWLDFMIRVYGCIWNFTFLGQALAIHLPTGEHRAQFFGTILAVGCLTVAKGLKFNWWRVPLNQQESTRFSSRTFMGIISSVCLVYFALWESAVLKIGSPLKSMGLLAWESSSECLWGCHNHCLALATQWTSFTVLLQVNF